MKNLKMLTEFNKKNCIKNNLIASSIFLIMFAFVGISSFAVFLNSHMKIIENADVGFVSFMALLLILLFFLSLLSNLVMPLLICTYSKFTDNLKSLIGLWLCNLILILVAWPPVRNYKDFIIFLFVTTFGSFIILILKYLFIKKKVSKI